MKLTILHENEDFIIVNKPQGLQVHGTSESLTNVAKLEFNSDLIAPVHRLDKDTSGAIILAKTTTALSQLSQLFERREINKCYLAVSHKRGKKKQGNVVGDMTKSRNGSYKLLPTTDAPAITRFISASIGPAQRLFALYPQTGKTHQLRVALKAIGSPILGDKRYGTSEPSDRMYLHAHSLSFKYNNEHFNIVAPIESGLHWPASSVIEALKLT